MGSKRDPPSPFGLRRGTCLRPTYSAEAASAAKAGRLRRARARLHLGYAVARAGRGTVGRAAWVRSTHPTTPPRQERAGEHRRRRAETRVGAEHPPYNSTGGAGISRQGSNGARPASGPANTGAHRAEGIAPRFDEHGLTSNPWHMAGRTAGQDRPWHMAHQGVCVSPAICWRSVSSSCMAWP